MQELQETAIKAAITAGKILKEGFGTSFDISHKGYINNLVTEYDTRSEETIIKIITEKFPSHSFLAEESGKSGQIDSSEIKWIIDPLDGTVNYAHNVPIYCVSIAAEYKGELVCGAIYNPMLDELFTAVKGGGAFLNDRQIKVSQNASLKSALMVTGFPYQLGKHKFDAPKLFLKLVSGGIPVRRLGSAALDLTYVAAGRFDGFWEIFLKPWDVAAGVLILNEAGGKISQYDGKPYTIYDDNLIATNGLIHQQLSETILEHLKNK